MEQAEERRPLLSASASSNIAGDLSFATRTETQSNDSFRRCASSFCVLLTVTFERIAFYALAGNLFLFLYQKPFEWVSYNAMNAMYVLTGVTYIFSFFGGWIGDSIVGRFWTITIALILYTASYGVLPILADTTESNKISDMCLRKDKTGNLSSNVTALTDLYYSDGEPCSWLIYLLLTVIGIATGTVKANIAPFGADQVRSSGPDSLRVFFNWFYWCVNIGSFVAIGAIAYIQQSMERGFFFGYLVPALCLAFAIVIFAFGRPLYASQSTSGSAVMAIYAIIKEACKSNYRQKSREVNQEETSNIQSVEAPPSWLDMAKVQYGGKYHETVVEDVKTLGRVMIVFVALIPYWLLYFQMQTTFLAQGIHMRLSPYAQNFCNSTTEKESEKEFSIPAAWLTLFDVIFLLVFIPLMDRVIYPCLDRHGRQIPLLSRISLGMFFAFLSMVVAGLLETYRLDLVNNKHHTICQVIGNTTYAAADMWIFWQIPQYALIGLSEVFASVAGLEFACSQAPRSMQGIIMGLFCFCTGIGSFLGTGLLFAFKDVWLSKVKDGGNINYGHLNYYFFLLGGIQAVTLLVFFLFKNKLEAKRPSIFYSYRQKSQRTVAPST